MRYLLKSLDMIRQCDPAAFGKSIVYVILQSLLPLANLYVLKVLIDTVSAQYEPSLLGNIYWVIFLFCFLFLISRVVAVLDTLNNDILTQKLTDYLNDRIQQQSAALDLAYFDNPKYHDTFHRAQQEVGFRPLRILSSFMSLFGSVISIFGVLVILVSFSWWIIAVMVVTVIPAFFLRVFKSQSIYKFRKDNTQSYRRTSYYSAVLNNRDFAKELRAFGLSGYFRSRFVSIRKELVSRLVHISRRLAWLDTLCAIIETAALLFVFWTLINQAYVHAISIGSFVLYFEAFRRGGTYLNTLASSVSSLYDNRLFISNLFEFLELRPSILSPKEPVIFPETVNSVEFRDVTFRYPDMNRDVLSHFSMMAFAGQIQLIEGQNGFGKTTLVKLLLRLYEPDEGAIMINGINIRQFDIAILRQKMGVIFQDYIRFYATAAENIAFGDVEHFDMDRIKSASQLAGVHNVIESLPQGYETPLGRMFDNGAELSLGQWQRLALARQLYSNAPVLVFDEPTAWMDTASRTHFDETLSRLQQDNKVIILIKHI